MVAISEVQESFWGLCLDSKKRYKTTLQDDLHISMAVLQDSGNPNEGTDLKIERGNTDVILCRLSSKHFQQALDLNFRAGESICLYTENSKGKGGSSAGTIHLSGYIMPDMDTEVAESDSEDEVPNLTGDDSMFNDSADFDSEDDDSDELSDDDDDSEMWSDPSDLDEDAVTPEKQLKMIKSATHTDKESTQKKKDKKDKNINKKNKLPTLDLHDDEEDDDDDMSDDYDMSDDDDSEMWTDSETDLVKEKMTPKKQSKLDKSATQIESAQKKKDKNQRLNQGKNTPKSAKKKEQNKAQTPGQKRTLEDGTTTKSGKKQKQQSTPQGNVMKPQSPKPLNGESAKKKKQDKNAATPQSKPQVRNVNGIQVTDIREGKGQVAADGKNVCVYYTGKLKNGQCFDKCVAGKPFKFKLGKHDVIKGWDIGVKGMKIGGKRKLVIPAHLAYGAQRVGEIPPNSTLTFEVELKAVN